MPNSVYVGLLILIASLPVCSQTTNQSVKSEKRLSTNPITIAESDRTRDGLRGPVRRVRTEVVKLTKAKNRVIEGHRSLLEIVSYDIEGRKIESQYFPISEARPKGKETYKYDDQGNICEMSLLGDDGSLLVREVYRYDFDFAGNWNRMTTLATLKVGETANLEPTEVTYRSIMYYLDEKILKESERAGNQEVSPSNKVVAGSKGSQPRSTVAEQDLLKDHDSTARRLATSLPKSNLPALLPLTATSETPETGNRYVTQGVMVLPLNTDAPPPPVQSEPISGGVLNRLAVTLPPPTYPESAKKLRLSGIVSVEVLIDESGNVLSARAISGPTMLQEVAVDAAKRAHFSPIKLLGKPVKVKGTVNYKF
jgi:TonB family protein